MADEKNRRIQVDLSGQTAIVTGASRGIGKAIALRLAAAGAKVACVARSADKLKETADAITAAGGTAEVHPCDVTDSAAVTKLVEDLAEKWGGIDIVVNNAGITKDTLIPRMEDEQWDAVIATNLRSVFLFTRAASLVMMRKRSGRIINISSVSGLMGNSGPVELLGLEGRRHRLHANGGPGACQPQGDRERHLPGVHRQRNDGRDGSRARRVRENADSRSSGWEKRTRWRTPCCTWPATRQPILRAKSSQSTAV